MGGGITKCKNTHVYQGFLDSTNFREGIYSQFKKLVVFHDFESLESLYWYIFSDLSLTIKSKLDLVKRFEGSHKTLRKQCFKKYLIVSEVMQPLE